MTGGCPGCSKIVFSVVTPSKRGIFTSNSTKLTGRCCIISITSSPLLASNSTYLSTFNTSINSLLTPGWSSATSIVFLAMHEPPSLYVVPLYISCGTDRQSLFIFYLFPFFPSSGAVLTCSDKTDKEGMRVVGTGPKLRVKLSPQIPGMIGQLYYFNQVFIR